MRTDRRENSIYLGNKHLDQFKVHYIEVKGVRTNPDSWPIQVRNGAISVDFGCGCLKCGFCITRR